ncbi:UDENN domain-containing protein [Favolaschia claudopus]|uniref:UDENN domain-containing protein n=1 Tax=Favolaschia claudopus TaxID=2862362 RepID=A0AAW0A9M4_9AGAR
MASDSAASDNSSMPDTGPNPPTRIIMHPRRLSRSQTLPSRSPPTKALRKNSEIEALVVDSDVLSRIRRWLLVITGIYPPVVLYPTEAENISFSAFPDSPQFEDGSQDHSFCIRESSIALSDNRRPASKDGFWYGFCHFTQRKDASSKRGARLFSLTQHAYPALFGRMTAILGPLFQQHDLPMLEAACHNIATWSDPTPGLTTELGFLGTVLSIELPHSAEQQQLANKTYDPRQHILASSASFSPPPLLLFEAALPQLWSLWECLILCEPLLPSGGSATSSAPLPQTGDIRPYLTIHDSDHATLASRLPPAAGRILGVTNPMFERSCAHWPHILSLGRHVPLNTATHGASAGNTRARAGPPPGWKTRTHSRYISKDRALLRRLEEACANGSDGDRLEKCSSLSLATYIPSSPTPAERASASSASLSSTAAPEPLRMKPFSAPAFLASLKTAGTTLPFRSTARRKEFYERWLRTPTFGVWLGLQEGIVHGVLEGG